MLKQVFIYNCDACGREERQEFEMGFTSQPVHPYPPVGWTTFLYGPLYCDRHSVIMQDKEEALAKEPEK